MVIIILTALPEKVSQTSPLRDCGIPWIISFAVSVVLYIVIPLPYSAKWSSHCFSLASCFSVASLLNGALNRVINGGCGFQSLAVLVSPLLLSLCKLL